MRRGMSLETRDLPDEELLVCSQDTYVGYAAGQAVEAGRVIFAQPGASKRCMIACLQGAMSLIRAAWYESELQDRVPYHASAVEEEAL